MPDAPRPQQFVRSVLVVEDDYEFADVLTEVLIHENCTVDQASNGMEALEKIRTGNYDAVICDLMMPRVDGESVYREVERRHPYLASRFLFITGQTTQSAGMADFVSASGNPLLIKPFDIEEFRRVLHELFSR